MPAGEGWVVVVEFARLADEMREALTNRRDVSSGGSKVEVRRGYGSKWE